MSEYTVGYVRDDGGREEAGYRGHAGDCGTRAAAIVTGVPYQEVYDRINELAQAERPRSGRKRSNARTGIWPRTLNRFLEEHGYEWVPTMTVGSGCTVHLRADELPAGRIVVRVSKHFAAVINGVLHDTHDCSRDGSRCVYGYWRLAAPPTEEG